MAWNAISIETSISCPKKSVSFLSGNRESSFQSFICPLSITGLIYRSGCLFSGLEACYHFFELWIVFYIDFQFRHSKNMVLFKVVTIRDHFNCFFIWKPYWRHNPCFKNRYEFTVLLLIYNRLNIGYLLNWQLF